MAWKSASQPPPALQSGNPIHRPENFTGEKGKGGMATEGTGKNAARNLGQGWKVSPSVRIKGGGTFTLADIDGSGAIQHI